MTVFVWFQILENERYEYPKKALRTKIFFTANVWTRYGLTGRLGPTSVEPTVPGLWYLPQAELIRIVKINNSMKFSLYSLRYRRKTMCLSSYTVHNTPAINGVYSVLFRPNTNTKTKKVNVPWAQPDSLSHAYRLSEFRVKVTYRLLEDSDFNENKFKFALL